MSSVLLIPFTAPASAWMLSTPYGLVTLYVAPSIRPAARTRMRPKLICWPGAHVGARRRPRHR